MVSDEILRSDAEGTNAYAGYSSPQAIQYSGSEMAGLDYSDRGASYDSGLSNVYGKETLINQNAKEVCVRQL